ncbi:hypothetical protein GGP48_000279 [Salinibacter ruber]|nr:hypothetical protein [Salinibacter ruber]
MVELSKLHAVATGDIVESSDLPADRRRQLPDRLRSTYETVQQTAPEELPYELAITGGDGWQCYVRNPATALARLLHFWTLLYAQGLPSRMALVVDTVDFVSEEDLNESDGRAFRRSGRLLSSLNGERWFDGALPTDASEAHHVASEGIGELVDLFFHEWTEAQARAIAGMIGTIGTEREITQEKIAAQWTPEPVTRQAINRHLKRAHWNRVERTVTRFEHLCHSLQTPTLDE